MVCTDSVSRTMAGFVISYKNKKFSEFILKNDPSQWLLIGEGGIAPLNVP